MHSTNRLMSSSWLHTFSSLATCVLAVRAVAGRSLVSCDCRAAAPSAVAPGNHALAVCPPTPSPRVPVTPAPDPEKPPVDPTAFNDNWQWRDIPGAMCANGDSTGYAVNLIPNSPDLFIYLRGGGECDSFITCNLTPTASYVKEGYSNETFQDNDDERAYLQEHLPITRRADLGNPFRAMNMAYVPYCTGDVHAGNMTLRYSPSLSDTHHVGSVNVLLYLQDLRRTLPGVRRVILAGSSAGGFGTVANYDRAVKTFGCTPVDLLDDSGVSFAGTMPPASWNVQYPAVAEAPVTDFSQVFTAVMRAYPGARFALTSYTLDDVLPAFEKTSVFTLRDNLEKFGPNTAAALANFNYFYVGAVGHEVLKDLGLKTDGVTVGTWLTQFANGSADWASQDPGTCS